MDDILVGIGHELKAAREARGFSIPQAADRLRVRERYLIAAEEGNFSDIPNRGTYITGFLRAYARLCDLNSESLIARYKEAVGEEEGHDYNFPQVVRRRFWPRVAKTAAFALVLGAGFYLYQQHGVFEGWVTHTADGIGERFGSKEAVTSETEAPSDISPLAEQPVDENPPADLTEAKEPSIPQVEKIIENTKTPDLPVQTPTPQATPQVPSVPGSILAAEPEVVTQAIPTPPSEPSLATTTTQEPVSETATTPPSPTSTDNAVKTETEQPAPPSAEPAKKIAVLESSPKNRIVLLAKEDTWVKVMDDQNNFIVERVMKVGDTYFLPEKQNLKITTGNADSIEVFVEGEQQSFLGTLSDLQHKQ
jgi:cytoskeleton protein RodZ